MAGEWRPVRRSGCATLAARGGLPARDCWRGSDPPGRAAWACTCRTCPMPHWAYKRGGSLPTTARRGGSAPAIRVPWPNPKPSGGLRNPRSAHVRGIPVHKHLDVEFTTPVSATDSAEPGHFRCLQPRHFPCRLRGSNTVPNSRPSCLGDVSAGADSPSRRAGGGSLECRRVPVPSPPCPGMAAAPTRSRPIAAQRRCP